MCGELRVGPGDLVVGDDDGVVVVPQAVAVDLMRRLAQAAETAGTAGLRFCACRTSSTDPRRAVPESAEASTARTPAAGGFLSRRFDLSFVG